MRSLLSFTIESFMLFEATLLQYAHFAAADTTTSPGNLSTTASPSGTGSGSGATKSCNGCVITAHETLLSYPHSVQETTSDLSVTVIPYVTVYDDGISVTRFSTYTDYNSASGSSGLAPKQSILTWEQFGTVLTYPTTYLAYSSLNAGTIGRKEKTCSTASVPVTLSPEQQKALIYPLRKPGKDIEDLARTYVDAMPTISAVVAPHKPADCSHQMGLQVLETSSELATATAQPPKVPVPVMHTSVRFLTTGGQAVITRATGNAPATTQGQNEDNNGDGNDGDGNGGMPSEPTSTPPPNGGQGGRPNNPGRPTPVIVVGESTVTAGPSGGFNVGGTTLYPGSSAQVINGQTVSVQQGGSVAVIDGSTATLATATVTDTESSGPAQATGAAPAGQLPDFAMRLWMSFFAMGALSMVLGICL